MTTTTPGPKGGSRRTAPTRERRFVGHKLLPGKPGTRRFLAEYGSRLVCVRYRYDADRAVRITTVELIVDERPWNPSVPPDTVVGVRIAWEEFTLRQQLRAEGARWDAQRKLWLVPWRTVRKLDLRSKVDPATFPPAVLARLPRPFRDSLGLTPQGGETGPRTGRTPPRRPDRRDSNEGVP